MPIPGPGKGDGERVLAPVVPAPLAHFSILGDGVGGRQRCLLRVEGSGAARGWRRVAPKGMGRRYLAGLSEFTQCPQGQIPRICNEQP